MFYDFVLSLLIAGAFCSILSLIILVIILKRAQREEIETIIGRWGDDK